jgi:hypothetical protein
MNDTVKHQFEKELADIENDPLFTAAYRKKKLITYCIRTIVAIILYVVFWKHQWVRWSLIAYIPLNLFSLFSLIGWRYFLRRKIGRVKGKIDQMG